MESLQEFYEKSERRDSEELKFGAGWRSRRNDLFDFALFWIADTGELCVLRSPKRDVVSMGSFNNPIAPAPIYSELNRLDGSKLSVDVLAVIPKDELLQVMDGWEEHHRSIDGLEWVRSRLDTHVGED